MLSSADPGEPHELTTINRLIDASPALRAREGQIDDDATSALAAPAEITGVDGAVGGDAAT
jgi:hypothetical protein